MARDFAGAPESAVSTFGQRLRALREAAGLSQEVLAERARMSPDAVSALERGTRTRPYPATVRALATALELAPEEQSALAATVPRRAATIGRRSGGPQASRLPASTTPLLGRDDDVAAVAELLSSPSVRLVTLTGIGGIGKTRLAVAVAERIRPALTDGVAYVPLAAVLDEASVWPEVGRALGVETTGKVEGSEEILDVAAGLELLLVLDNCEHLAGAAGIVTETPRPVSGLDCAGDEPRAAASARRDRVSGVTSSTSAAGHHGSFLPARVTGGVPAPPAWPQRPSRVRGAAGGSPCGGRDLPPPGWAAAGPGVGRCGIAGAGPGRLTGPLGGGLGVRRTGGPAGAATHDGGNARLELRAFVEARPGRFPWHLGVRRRVYVGGRRGGDGRHRRARRT